MDYAEAIYTASGLFEPGEPAPPDYWRGVVNLLAELYAIPGVLTGDRMEAVAKDLHEAIEKRS